MSSATLPVEFQKRLDRFFSTLEKEPIYILVWGSGMRDVEAFSKRIAIKDHLVGILGDGCVFLSEDPAFQILVEKYGMRAAEGAECACVDVVIILDTSIGPHSELFEYEDILRSKALVFVSQDRRNSGGFPQIAFDLVKVETYTDKEYIECKKIRRLSNDFVQAIRFEKARRRRLKSVLR